MKNHKILIISIISIMLLILTIIPGLQLYLNSPDGHAYIRRKFNEALPNKFLGTVNFKQAHLAIFSGFISFDSLTVFDSTKTQFATIPLAVAKFTLPNLLKVHTKLDSLILIAPKCAITNGQIENIWNLKPDSLPPVKPDLIIKSFLVRHGNFSYTDPKNQLQIVSRCRDIYSEFDFPGGYFFFNFKNTVTDIKYTFLNKVVQTDFITAKVNNNRLSLSDGKLSCQGVDLELGGSVDNLFNEPYFHLKIQTAINSKKFLGHLSTFKNDNGNINTQIQLNGTLAHPDFHATLKHHGGTLAGVKFDSLLADVSYINNYLTIKKAALVSESGKIHIYGLLDFHRVFSGQLFTKNPDYNAVQYSLRADGDDVLRLFTKDSLFSMLPLKGYISWCGSGIIPQFMIGEIKSELYTQAKDSSSSGITHFIKIKSNMLVNSGKIRLVKSEIEHNGSNLKGTGEYNFFTGLLNFSFYGNASLLPPENLFGFNSYKAVLGIRGSFSNSELYADLSKNNGAERGTVETFSLRATIQPNGYLKINRADFFGDGASLKIKGFITAPYFFNNPYTNAALSAEFTTSDLSLWWPESLLKGSLYSSINLLQKKSQTEIKSSIGATGLNFENYGSNLAAYTSLKGKFGAFNGDFQADLTRNLNNPVNIIKLTGTVSDSIVNIQSINIPAAENRKYPSRNLQLEYNFVDQVIKKLNFATDGKFIFSNKK